MNTTSYYTHTISSVNTSTQITMDLNCLITDNYIQE